MFVNRLKISRSFQIGIFFVGWILMVRIDERGI